nr:putative holin-like toxin [Gorillibacterium massiliense]
MFGMFILALLTYLIKKK